MVHLSNPLLDPACVSLREEEGIYLRAFNEATLDEERFLKQKAKLEWLRVGDSNSAYFHKTVKERVSRNRIDIITDMNNVTHINNEVPTAFVEHYMNFLGSSAPVSNLDNRGLFSKKISNEKADYMVREVTNGEIKDAMLSIDNDKAPGPDGFTSLFFKKSWDLVGNDVCNSIRDFFGNGKLLQELNHTILALIPKISAPTRRNDYRPISCCNVLYKCVSKIITNRIKDGLEDVVSDNQSAFVPGRILAEFGFHSTMIHWIMTCVMSTSFSLCINGELHGYFQGRRGLKQGDPMSPYLFTLVMEVLSLMLKCRVREADGFQYHNSHIKASILHLMPFEEGTLPIKYLGAPLISSRLVYKDCKILVERVQDRIGNWKNKSLSFAGRLQLIMSVLSSMHLYWASVFILPNRILDDLDQLMRGFLWYDGSMKRGKSKVTWEDVCLPKHEGGLGTRTITWP
ncbi:hypothetical protein Tco_0404967 [Tanacetum coccineum]